jgi:hypothetical protein
MPLSREHELLGDLLRHPAWEGILKPVIVERVQGYYTCLLNPSAARKDATNDDFLRGAIVSLKWVVEYPQEEINAARLEAEKEEALVRETEAEIPLFGGGRPAPENGDGHGRPEGFSG